MLPSLFLSSTAITLLTRGLLASSKISKKGSCLENKSYLTWNIEKFFRLKSSALILIELGEILIKLLKFFLSDYISSIFLEKDSDTYNSDSSIDLGLWLADFPCFLF
jgi:hypothetical protein